MFNLWNRDAGALESYTTSTNNSVRNRMCACQGLLCLFQIGIFSHFICNAWKRRKLLTWLGWARLDFMLAVRDKKVILSNHQWALGWDMPTRSRTHSQCHMFGWKASSSLSHSYTVKNIILLFKTDSMLSLGKIVCPYSMAGIKYCVTFSLVPMHTTWKQ